jgi:hypothetical protein
MTTPSTATLIVPPNYELALYGWQFTHVVFKDDVLYAMKYNDVIKQRKVPEFWLTPMTFVNCIDFILNG